MEAEVLGVAVAAAKYALAVKTLLLLALGCLALFGCGAKPTPAGSSSSLTTASDLRGGSNAGGSNNGDGVGPIGPNVGPMTPVVGGENLDGGTGGGLGQRAKDMARNAASQSSNGTTSTGDDTGQ